VPAVSNSANLSPPLTPDLRDKIEAWLEENEFPISNLQARFSGLPDGVVVRVRGGMACLITPSHVLLATASGDDQWKVTSESFYDSFDDLKRVLTGALYQVTLSVNKVVGHQALEAAEEASTQASVKALAASSLKDCKLMVFGIEPAIGYLDTFQLPTTIVDVIAQVGDKYGGGEYEVRVVDYQGKYIKSKVFQ